MNVEIKHQRRGLIEGRVTGLGYGFLKKISDDQYETVMPMSTGKDYLNDVVYVEANEIPTIGSIYGFNYKNQNLFKDSDFAYLGGMVYNNDKYNEVWQANLHNIQALVNYVEREILNQTIFTTIHLSNNGVTIIKLNKLWVTNPYYISFVSYLMRVGFNYDGKEDIYDYLTVTRRKTNIEGNDIMRIEKFISLMKRIKRSKKFLSKYPYIGNGYIKGETFVGPNSVIHNNGIMSINLA